MPGRIEFEFKTRPGGKPPRPLQTQPMRILVMGDFTAAAQANTPLTSTPVAERKLYPVDIDNLDQLIARLKPAATLQLDDNLSVEFSPRELEDFHPDQLFRKLSVFDTLRDLRKRLHDNNSYPDAAAQFRELMHDRELPDTAEDSTRPSTPPSSMETDTSTLERLLGKSVGDTSDSQRKGKSIVSGFISQVLSDQIVADADPGQEVYFSAVDEAIGTLMRRILHHQDFQNLEAIWRSIHFLITRLELGEDLQLSILDITRQELLDDINSVAGQLEQSALYRLLVEQGVQIPGNPPWSMLIGNYSFGASAQDITLLAALGTIASHAGGPFIAAADPVIAGNESFAKTPELADWKPLDGEDMQNWEAMREHPAAAWIGLALPRMLLRLPYGESTDELDDFTFEEVNDTPDHKAFLWGNPAFGCAALIGQAFTQRGWQMEPGDTLDIGELPAHTYRMDQETKITPCAETYLTESVADKMLGQGLMPLLSVHNTNRVHMLRFQSISKPARALAGNWQA